jgi:anthranilate phosphoribosyltransferase
MGGNARENAAILMDVLSGRISPRRDIVILNAAAAIYAADKARSIKEGIKLAVQAIDSGMAMKKLELLKEYSFK